MEVRHQAVEQRFVGQVNGQTCELDYRLSDGVVSFVHTGVPYTLRGHGLAAQLVETGLQWARDEGLRVRAPCSYVARYIERHPVWQDLLA